MTDPTRQKFVPAVENAVLVLRLLVSGGRPMGATTIARETGLNVSSAFNILRTLANERLITFDPLDKTYLPGLGLLELATPLLGANPADMIRPLLKETSEQHQMMIVLWQITQTERIVMIDRFTPARVVQAVIARNSRLPVFGGAVGRCYAAAMKLDKAQTRAGYDGVRWQSPPGFDAYWADVQTARTTGTAFDHGQLFRGLEITASLVRDADGTPRFGMSSITIAGQHDDASLTAMAAALGTAARHIERGVFGRTADA
jgi:DNA-binding IclR family transcriptional regulator